MTLIAGIISRRDQPLPETACANLAQSISRNANDEVIVFRDRSSYFVKVDIGAFGSAGFYVDADGVQSFLTGEPLLAPGDDSSATSATSHRSRLQDLTTLHDQLLRNNWDALRGADGTFSIAQYQPQTNALVLAADKLGIRPLYYWLNDDLIVFASALRILEECPPAPKKMDLRAVTEMVGLDMPLADRTPYAGISLLKAGEVVQITNANTSRHYYWRWDEIEVSRESEESRLATVYDCFQSAVKHRLGSDKSTAAYLSGGLDSRCIVTALRDHSVRVHTVNFARPGTQDDYFGNRFAAKIGSNHQSVPRTEGDTVPDYSTLMARVLASSARERRNTGQLRAERPRLVWSGEGGSVLLGHVHLSEKIVALMRAGDVDGAIDEYLEREQVHVPRKLFRKQVLGNARGLIKQGIREELDQWRSPDPGRNFYLFLMLNEQRRKLMIHFENIDRHRLEFQLPFFDARFVAAVVATPLDVCLRHKFYVKWLSQFSPVVRAVGWQAYPEHEPCPLPAPADLDYQWDDGCQAKENAARKQRVVNLAFNLLRAGDFPDRIISRRNLRLAAWLHARGWRDYHYAIEAAQTYYAYSKKCGGEFTFSLS
jgi:asparagine synthase (glutamine-hydrolysing)